VATLDLIREHRPALVMSVGTAGAIGPLDPGTVVVATEVASHDQGVYLKNRFLWTGGFLHRAGGGRVLKEWFRLSPRLEVATRCWASEQGRDVEGRQLRLVWGRVVTGDQVILSQARKEFLRLHLGADAVEMEAAAVVQVASSWGVPWLVVRAISDAADEVGGFDFTPLSRLRYGQDGVGQRLGAVPGLVKMLASTPDWRKRMASIQDGLRLGAQQAAEVALGLASSRVIQDGVRALSTEGDLP
jgi:nucleoside phosphorylase